ncbi:MAG TPA: hypothetical protein VGM06_00230 [Polyangiaceae bacterium]
MTVRRRELAVAAVLAVVFGAAPTPGDIGACGHVATALDVQGFAAARKQLDCQRCGDCGLTTQTCNAACDPNAPSRVAFPATCHPLDQDGQVCLRALAAASCSDYAGFVDDVSPTEPTECDFCQLLPEAGLTVGQP